MAGICIGVVSLHGAATGRGESIEALEQGSAFRAHLVDPLFGSDFIIFDKVLIEVSLESLVSDESHTAVGAFELDSFVKLRD